MDSFPVSLVIIFNFIRCTPHLLIFIFHKNRTLIKSDISRWLKVIGKKYSSHTGLIYLLGFFPEFRNLFYNRIGFSAHFLNIFCQKMTSLRIITKNIGEGLYISHGIASSISAKSIGQNCWIGHQVSIGNYDGFPTILDNVTIHTGAVIIGDITIGNNSVIGANTTVFTDVPDNCTVYPASCRLMKWEKTKI